MNLLADSYSVVKDSFNAFPGKYRCSPLIFCDGPLLGAPGRDSSIVLIGFHHLIQFLASDIGVLIENLLVWMG